MRVLEPVPSAATSTRKPSLRRALMRAPSPSTSPTTGSNALAARTGVSGWSGPASTSAVPARVCASRRSNESERRGAVCGIGRTPCGGERRRERELLVEQLLGPVAEPARFDDGNQRAPGQEIREQVLLGREPRQPGLHAVERLAVGESLPLLTAPRVGLQQLGGAGAHVVGGQQLADREEPHLGDVAVRSLIGHGELREPVDLVTP